MPPILAGLLTHGFIAWLFWRDFRERPNVTRALWLPIIWFFIISTRFVSEWLGFFGLPLGSTSLEEGSPVDALVYFALIAAGLYVLNLRRVRVTDLFRHNRWLMLFFAYCFLAILWSDFPFVSFKRWIKILGHPIMVLILLTEPDPQESIMRMMKRYAYIVVPISILFIKYYPQHGRHYDSWTGMPGNTGITTNKNMLGCDCLILWYSYFWHFLKTLKSPRSAGRRNELLLTAGFLFMIGWLMYMAHSSTSLVSLVAAVCVMIFVGLPFINKRRIGTYFVIIGISLVTIEKSFDASARLIALLGKDPTLTDRTIIWEAVLNEEINPILGTGFESFWLGERYERLGRLLSFPLNQAHNGYIETYLNLGLVGLGLLLGLLLVTFFKARADLLRNFDMGQFRIGFVFAIALYNWTEASFKAVHPMLFVFCIVAIDYPRIRAVRRRATDPPFASELKDPAHARGELGAAHDVVHSGRHERCYCVRPPGLSPAHSLG